MILRGLLVTASGFLFIFSPGLPMGLLARRGVTFDRDLIYWGIGLWLVALLPSLFLQSLLRQTLQINPASGDVPTQPLDLSLPFIGALITSTFVSVLLYWRLRRVEAANLLPNGLSLGIGVGLIAQIFTGLSLVGAGFRLMFGDTSSPTLVSLALIPYLDLVIGLLALILFRPALLLVSAARSVLIARAVSHGLGFFGLAVLVDALFVWLTLVLQSALGGDSSGQSLVGAGGTLAPIATVIYYAIIAGLAYLWLGSQIAQWQLVAEKGKR